MKLRDGEQNKTRPETKKNNTITLFPSWGETHHNNNNNKIVCVYNASDSSFTIKTEADNMEARTTYMRKTSPMLCSKSQTEIYARSLYIHFAIVYTTSYISFGIWPNQFVFRFSQNVTTSLDFIRLLLSFSFAPKNPKSASVFSRLE